MNEIRKLYISEQYQTIIMPFQKGQSGNPGGRPKRDWTWASLYEEEVSEKLTAADGTQIDANKAVAKRIVKMAIEGDIQAIKELTNRMDGIPKQDIDITSGGESLAPNVSINTTKK